MPNAMDPKYEYEVASSIYPDPTALYERDPYWHKPFLYEHRITISSGVCLGITRVWGLWMRSRPLYSGIHVTAAYIVTGLVLGAIGQKGLDSYIAFRGQVHRHYLQLHPERFPPPKKERVGDLYELWVPSRQ